MKLYYSPGACSLATHIALHEADFRFEHERVDLRAKTTESGADFLTINAKGYVPALTLDTGETITENVAVLDWISLQAPRLGPSGPMGRTHLLQALAFISTEIHKGFKPFFAGAGSEERDAAGGTILKRMQYLADTMGGDFLFGSDVSVADFYLFVTLLWAQRNELDIPAELAALRSRLMVRPSVVKAMTHEGLV